MHIDIAAVLEVIVNRLRRNRANAENRLEQARARTQIRDIAQEFKRVTLGLERIILSAVALKDDFRRLHFKRTVASGDELAGRANGGTVANRLHGGKVLHLIVVDNLHRGKHRSVKELDEADALLLAVVANPALHRHTLTFQLRALCGDIAQIKHILICHRYSSFPRITVRVSFCLYRYMIAKTPRKGKGYRFPAFISP